MESSTFDDLTRTLAKGRSRRTVLRGLAGGLAGMLAGGALTRHGAAAADRSLVICHATGDPNAPYQAMTILQSEMNLHARHGDHLRVDCCTDSDCVNQGHLTCQTGYCTGTFICGEPGAPCTLSNYRTACCSGPSGIVGCTFPTGDFNDGVCFQV